LDRITRSAVQPDLPLDFWSLATEGTQESGCAEYKDLPFSRICRSNDDG
jgi:hypothetical protein